MNYKDYNSNLSFYLENMIGCSPHPICNDGINIEEKIRTLGEEQARTQLEGLKTNDLISNKTYKKLLSKK